MNKNIHNGLVVASSILLLTGCGSSGSKSSNTSSASNTELPTSVQEALNAPTSTLSQALTNTLSYMGNEERLAYDVYNNLYAQWGTKQFHNIATKSEYKHITAVQKLVQKYKLNDDINFTNVDLPSQGYIHTPIEEMQAGTYDISKIQRLYDDLIAQGSSSEVDALKVGCTVEVVDVTDLNEYIQIAETTQASDVLTIFNFLREGSYHHYWAFDKGLKKNGMTQGCCTWSELCHPEYPQKEEGDKGKCKDKNKNKEKNLK